MVVVVVVVVITVVIAEVSSNTILSIQNIADQGSNNYNNVLLSNSSINWKISFYIQ